ncbi:MAG: MmgE/PrpD family protein [Acidimicrobiales bacterium]
MTTETKSAGHGVDASGLITRQLATYASTISFEDLPSSTIDAAKRAVLDQLGLILIGSTLPWTAPLPRVVKALGGTGESTILGTGAKAPALHAAMVNANFGHACEMDDSGYKGGCHAGALTIPPALALAERDHLTGREFLLAIVLGYEVLSRIGRVVTEPTLARGFHHQSVVGPFGVAALTGRLLGLDPDMMTHALSIAGSHAGGTMEYDQGGGEVKRYHSAMAVHGGMIAALLAQAGLTGPPAIFEGMRSVPRLFAGIDDTSEMLAGLDDSSWFAVEKTTVKPYPSAGTVHTSIHAMQVLVAEHGFGPGDIGSIDVWVSNMSASHGGSIVEPQDVIGAQFSMAFSLALQLIKGKNVLADYMDSNLWHDAHVKEVASRVVVHSSDKYAGPVLTGALVKVSLKDGRSVEREELYRLGSPENPLSNEELINKFRGTAGAVLHKRQLEDVLVLVERLDNLEDIGELVSAIKPPDGPTS